MTFSMECYKFNYIKAKSFCSTHNITHIHVLEGNDESSMIALRECECVSPRQRFGISMGVIRLYATSLVRVCVWMFMCL